MDQMNPMGKQVVGNAGMYYAAYRLSLLGWNVMPTARNARGIDLLAYDATGNVFKGFQIKALSKSDPVPIGSGVEGLMGHWWIIVSDIAANANPNCFIMTPSEVGERAQRREKGGRVSYFLQPKSYRTDEFLEKWDRIGHGNVAPAADLTAPGC